MTQITNELMFEVLKDLQQRLGRIEGSVKELHMGQVGIREDLHSLSGRVLSSEKTMLTVDDRLQRIERRLELVEA